jgi:thiol:disulfide interchange protein DsbD
VIRAAVIAALLLSGCESARDAATDRAPPKAAAPPRAAVPTTLTWLTDEKAALARARTEHKGVMIDFRSEWCAPCKELDARTFVDPAVIAYVAPRYVPLKLDLTQDTAADHALMERYRVHTLPTVMFTDASGAELGRIGEFLPPTQFLAAATSAENRSAAPAAPQPGH